MNPLAISFIPWSHQGLGCVEKPALNEGVARRLCHNPGCFRSPHKGGSRTEHCACLKYSRRQSSHSPNKDCTAETVFCTDCCEKNNTVEVFLPLINRPKHQAGQSKMVLLGQCVPITHETRLYLPGSGFRALGNVFLNGVSILEYAQDHRWALQITLSSVMLRVNGLWVDLVEMDKAGVLDFI